MTILLPQPEFHASVAEVRRTAETLLDLRARAAGQVDDLLDTWRGSAAQAFAEAWADWLSASASVAGALAESAEALDGFLSALMTCDAHAHLSLDHLSRRLP